MYVSDFQLKLIVKPDNIHDFTEISSFLNPRWKFAEANFKLVTVSHIYHITHN